MKKPTITIVIPCFNEASRLARCLDAIALQNVPVAEVIVVDNNSTDDTVKIAESYRFVRVIKESRQGIVFARNTGFDAVKSDIIGRIDADTILEPDWTERLTKFYQHHTGAVSGSSYFYNVPAQTFARHLTNFLLYRVDKLLSGFHTLWGSNMALPRELWLQVRERVCTENIHEDHDLANHIHEIGQPITYLRKLLAGVEMKAGFMGAGKTWEYLSRWPKMQTSHHIRGARVLWLIVVPMWLLHWVPVVARQCIDFTERRLFAPDHHSKS